MRTGAAGAVMKVWLFAIASVLGGAWITPLLYNAGKALAEVSASKATNGFLQWLAGVCGEAEFPAFLTAGVLLVGLVMFVPWMEWLFAGRLKEERRGPWRIRVRSVDRAAEGQPLARHVRGMWHCCAGFLVVSGLLLSMGVALVPAGLFSMKAAAEGNGVLAMRTLAVALGLALVMEVFFRGIVMGVFLRAMRPSAAVGMSAAYFALVMSVFPWGGVNVADPEVSGAGFALLREIGLGFSDGRMMLGRFVPLLALGGVLAYVRWRTASLWMPVGLHTGWLFAKGMLGELTVYDEGLSVREWALSGGLLQQGLVPMLGIFVAGMLAHFLTEHPEEEVASNS